MLNAAMTRPVLGRDVVRFAGEPVAAVVAETLAEAIDAAEQVIVEIEPLNVVVDPEDALTASVVLFDGAADNLALTVTPRKTADFSGCDVVVTQRMVNQRLAPAPIEARSAAAVWNGDALTYYASSQGAHAIRENLAAALNLEETGIRVITPDVGGAFGAKARAYPEDVLVAWLARHVGRPVRWNEGRSENLVAMGHGRGQTQTVTIGGSRGGTIEAYRLEVVQDAGAYPSMGAVLAAVTRIMTSGVYAVPSVEYSARSVVTNTAPTIAYRGAGRPEAAAAIERAVDLFAMEIGMDPAEVRRRNVVRPEAFPYRTPTGATYDSGDYAAALERVLDAADYDALRAEQRVRRERGDRQLLGIGLSIYVEITAGGGGGEYASVELQPNGKVRVLTGSTPSGQGHRTAWAMLAADRLGVGIDDVEVVHGDTGVVPASGVTGGSRSLQLAGSSVADAAERLLVLARERAADLLEAAVDDIVVDTGAFHVAGTPTIRITWADLAATVAAEPLAAVSQFAQDGATFPFGAHLAVVEVDRETGAPRLVRLVACDDAGRILNPLIVAGQVHGGLAQGSAQALYEEARYDRDGNPVTATFADYAIVSAAELPSFERIPMETPTPLNPLGAKGIGEAATIGSTPAVQNAVIDAVSHLGIRHIDLPCTPERVWQALEAAAPNQV
jgi:carbon-monoxide dehydrogenase large subunit